MEKEKLREAAGSEGIGTRTQLVSLAILFFVNLINYMDRLTVSAVLNVRYLLYFTRWKKVPIARLFAPAFLLNSAFLLHLLAYIIIL
jgi:hypothetical protein